MDTFTVSFFGHRRLDDPIRTEKALEKIISSLLRRPLYTEFLVGRDGEFDLLVSSVIHRCQRTIRDDNSAHIWVMPYMKAEFRNNEEVYRNYYDEVEIYERGAVTHLKAAFRARNRSMVDRSDLVVFCVDRNRGGAFQALRYAQQQGRAYYSIDGDLILYVEAAEKRQESGSCSGLVRRRPGE